MTIVDVLKHFFLGSGAAWVLWLLLGLAVASLAIALERLLFFRQRSAQLGTLAEKLEARLSVGDAEGARRLLIEQKSLAATVAEAGLRLAHLGPEAAEKAMAGASAVERDRLEARLAFLGTLGNNAPFVGLFGTVIGVIEAFDQLGATSPGGGGSGQAVSQAVMSGISEALIATAIGIAVALPAVAFYNYFQRRIARLLSGNEALTNLVLAYLLAESPRSSNGIAAAPERVTPTSDLHTRTSRS